jgi:hypothetical protein
MFELSDFKAKKSKPDSYGPKKADYGPVPSYGSADEYDYLNDRPKYEDGEILTYFKSKRISKSWTQWWIILQAFTLFYQMIFYSEVAGNASLYDSVVHQQCNQLSAGSCKSRLWENHYQMDIPITSGTDLLGGFPLHFATTSKTPISIQIDVLPIPADVHAPYELFLKRHAVGDLPERTFYEYKTTGLSSAVLTEDHQGTVRQMNITGPSGVYPRAVWEGYVKLGEYPGRFRYNDVGHLGGASYTHMLNRLHKELKSVRLSVNEINNFEMKEFNEKVGDKCELESSWKNVMLQAMSIGSRRLSWIQNMLMISIIASALVTFLVWAWYGGRRTIDGLSFHYIVGIKGLVQDMPLQGIVLYYIFSWYEAGGGERCQLCLLDMNHCQNMTPFHISNFILVSLVLASAVSNQFLFSADPAQLKSEDDYSFTVFFRYVVGI